MAAVRSLRPTTLGAVVEIALQRHQVKTGRALSRLSEEKGWPLSHTMLNELRRNAYIHPLGKDLREHLAKLSGVPLQVVDELAGARDLTPFDLPERAAELDGDQRRAVLAVISAFINANEALETALGGNAATSKSAARDTGQTSTGQGMRDAQDTDAEGSQDTTE